MDARIPKGLSLWIPYNMRKFPQNNPLVNFIPSFNNIPLCLLFVLIVPGVPNWFLYPGERNSINSQLYLSICPNFAQRVGSRAFYTLRVHRVLFVFGFFM